MPDKLAPYRGKRDFARSPEPAGQAAADAAGAGPEPGARRFVVQRHRARRLHYDLRFEIDGVLASWAVPRGPTLDPAVRRIAVHVEDHPIEYLDFEGVIPRGEYGGGDVIVWDRGTWEPHATDDPAAAVAAGELHADVHGEKLRGRLVLVRIGRGDGNQWLLLHKHDEYAVPRLGPGGPPRVGAQRAHQRRGQGRPGPDVAVRPAPGTGVRRAARPRRRGAARCRRAARRGGRAQPSGPGPPGPARAGGTWHVFGRELRLTNLDKVLFPGRPGEAPVTKRELIRYAAQVGPGDAALPGRPAAQHAPVPGRGRTSRASGTSSCPTTRRAGCRAGDNPAAGRARPRPTWSWTSPPRWCGWPTSARWNGTPGRPAPPSRTSRRTR